MAGDRTYVPYDIGTRNLEDCRYLVSEEEAAELTAAGYEVKQLRKHPYEPMPPGLRRA